MELQFSLGCNQSLAWSEGFPILVAPSWQDAQLLFKIRDATPELGSGKGERDSLGLVWLLASLRHQSMSTKPAEFILSVHSQSLAARVSQESRCSNRSDSRRRRSCCSRVGVGVRAQKQSSSSWDW